MSLVLAVIPARFASTRFPGKVLAPLGDGTMLQEVWNRVSRCKRVDRLLVATDDERVRVSAQAHGAEVVMTSSDHLTGTDRIAEVLEGLTGAASRPDIVLNVQADEPCVSATSLDRLVEQLAGNAHADLATLVEPIVDPADLTNPNVVKVVQDKSGRALYFSRSPIPYHRGSYPRLDRDFSRGWDTSEPALEGYWKHQGIYAYRIEAFKRMAGWSPSPLERHEGLEQLRALENGLTIQIVTSDFRSIGVDTPDDLQRVRQLMLEAH